MDRSVSFRDIQNDEEESTSGRTSTSSLSSMFADNNVHSLNHASIEAIEYQPQAVWKLPAISPNQVYNDLSMFHLCAVSRVIVKESVSRIRQNSDVSQTISLINVKEIQAEEKKHKTNFSVYTFDENLVDILKLHICTTGFDMCQTRKNISIQTRGCFRHTNTLYPAVMNAPSQTSKSSTLVITDPLNKKMEH
jgi:hypothetical protein